MSQHDQDDDFNPSDNTHFQTVLNQGLSSPMRRQILRGGVGLSMASVLTGCATLGQESAAPNNALGFSSLDKSLEDRVVLPAGYRYTVLHASGDPLDLALSAFSSVGTEQDDWSRRIGDHHDGMDLYFIDAKGHYTSVDTGRAVLCVNHESSADAHFLHPNGQTSNGVSGKKFHQFGNWDLGTRPLDEVMKEINLHGVSMVEIVRSAAGWQMVANSTYHRRVTPLSPVRIAAPKAAQADVFALMVTRFDPMGRQARGVLNPCGHGKTPWGTYLACEENWANYFQLSAGAAPIDARTLQARKRYGVVTEPLSSSKTTERSQGWHTVSMTDDRFSRWNLAAISDRPTEDFRQEENTFGYVVEMDPLAPDQRPAKRIALGRLAHEAAVCSIPRAGQPLVFYMGCDSRNEYIYKFVTAAVWDPRDVGGGMQAGDKYLNEGTLYVARFDADGKGQWLEVSVQQAAIAQAKNFAFQSQADVYVFTRLAADALGATPMDRPEWGAVNPHNGEVYFSLTNNNTRTLNNVNAANPRAYTDQDGKKQSGNPNGHIIRFREDGAPHALNFYWDIFVFGAEEDAGAANLSGLTAKNSFSSPDGLWFSQATGICWIQTDDGAMTDETNCMLLAAIPGRVGDGGKTVALNQQRVDGALRDGKQDTFVGALLGEARLRRFLIAPKGAEVTGLTESPDGKALFVNIQHPGEDTPALGRAAAFNLQSRWPGNVGYGPAGRPRSATIVITREDGGVIGV